MAMDGDEWIKRVGEMMDRIHARQTGETGKRRQDKAG
jgi:hypothetical protein